MAYTIADLKSDVEAHLHGTTLNKITGIDNLIFEAGRNVMTAIDPRETKRKVEVTNALYDQVYSYVVPTDLKGKKVVDLAPQINRSVSDNFSQQYPAEFDQYKSDGTLAIEDNSGIRTIRISKALTEGPLLNSCDSLTSNGTWAATASATGLEIDRLYKVTGDGSLRFSLAAAGSSGYVENSTMTAVDLSDIKNTGSAFVWVYLSATVPFTSVTLRWGSSASDYYTVTSTTPHDGASVVTGWNLFRFDWDGLTPSGSPVDTAIDYARVTISYNGTAMSAVRIDNIVFRQRSIWNLTYYSAYLFRTSAGTWIEKHTSDTDLINLSTESYNILLYELLLLVAQSVQGEEAKFDVDYYKEKRDEVWLAYKGDNKSETKKPQASYYRRLYKPRR